MKKYKICNTAMYWFVSAKDTYTKSSGIKETSKTSRNNPVTPVSEGPPSPGQTGLQGTESKAFQYGPC